MSLRMDTANLKTVRMKAIQQMITNVIKDGANHEFLLTRIEVEIGLSRKKASEYVARVLEIHPEWVLEDGTIRMATKNE